MPEACQHHAVLVGTPRVMLAIGELEEEAGKPAWRGEGNGKQG